MATESNLGTLHVFNSEESFNSNKNNVGSSDIAIVKIENLEISGYVSSGGIKLQPIHIADAKMEVLVDTPQGTGNIVLPKAYTKFDGLYVVIVNDDRNSVKGVFISSAEISRRIAYAKSTGKNWLLADNGGSVWRCTNTSTTKNLIYSYENCCIDKIYGVTL